MKYDKAIKEVAFDIEQKVRQALSDKYTSYMTSARSWELNVLAKLVDIRQDDKPKYSNLSIQDCFDLAKKITEEGN